MPHCIVYNNTNNNYNRERWYRTLNINEENKLKSRKYIKSDNNNKEKLFFILQIELLI